MTPEELKRLMEIIERSSAQWKADEMSMVWEEPPEVLESRKTMKAVQERLQKLIEHDRQKLQDLDKLLRWQKREFRKQRLFLSPERK